MRILSSYLIHPFSLSFLILAAVAANLSAEQRPNILFIGVDDLRCALGAMGDPLAVTPHMDRLAAEGTLFTRAYVQQAVCAASRASFLTGYRPDRTTVDYPYNKYFIEEFLPEHPSLPRYFFEQGYRAYAMGKIHHGHTYDLRGDAMSGWTPSPYERSDLPPWWQHYALPENQAQAEAARTHRSVRPPAWECADMPDDAYGDGRIARQAVYNLKRLAQESEVPFFLAVGFSRPHLPFVAPQRYWDLYERSDFDYAFPEAEPPYEKLATASYELPAYENRYTLNGAEVPEDAKLTLRHGYYASVSYADAQIGIVLDALDRLGLRENTVIVFWSDHGFHLAENDSWGKHTNFELATRSPLIVAGAGLPVGQVCEALVEYVDIFPTVTDLSVVDAPDDLDGRSLVPLLKNPEMEWADAAFSQYPRGTKKEGYSIRTDRYRYNEWYEKATGRVFGFALYDHEVDPTETKNFAESAPDVVADLQARVRAHFGYEVE